MSLNENLADNMQSLPQHNDLGPAPQVSSVVPQPQAAQQLADPAAPAPQAPGTADVSSPVPSQPTGKSMPAATATSAPRAESSVSPQAGSTGVEPASKTLPPWLEPFSNPLPVETLGTSEKKTVFAGLTGIVALPVIYGGLTGLTGFAIWYHFTANQHLLDNPLPILTYYGPIFGGAVLLLFFLVPFLYGRRPAQTAYPLDRSEHPAVFALVDAVAGHLGAPTPSHINASLDNAIQVHKGTDDKPEVTLGLPLVAVSTVRQTAGFLAGELYRYSSQPSAKCWSFAYAIQGLFAKAAYDSSQEDQAVIEWGGTSRTPATVTFGFIPWVFERIAAMFGEKIKERMVFDADRCQTRVAGSNTFAMSQLDRQLLDEVANMSRQGFSAARAAGQVIENLPAFYANKLKLLKSEQPDFVKRICQKLMEQGDGAKPPMSERIAVAQQHKDQGILPVDKPSVALFQDFTQLCRRISAQHYQTHFAAELSPSNVQPATPATANAMPSAPNDVAAQAIVVPPTSTGPEVATGSTPVSNVPQNELEASPPRLETPIGPPNVATPVETPNATPGEIPNPVESPPTPLPPVAGPTAGSTPPSRPQEHLVNVNAPVIPAAASIPAVTEAVGAANGTPPPLPAPIAPRPVVATNSAVKPLNSTEATNPAPSVAPTVPVAKPDTGIGNFVACFMQTEVLTDNHELFLPLKELTASKQPEQSARMLKTARQRYEDLLSLHGSNLAAFSNGIRRSKSLMIARTISLVGLPIKASELGLSHATNAAITVACQELEQQNGQIREQLRELRDQAVLRFVTATQLAATPAVAESIGLASGEVERAQLAVKCLAKLKSIWSLIDDLDQKHTQLYSLLYNLPGNQQSEDLTSVLNLTCGEIHELIEKALTHVSEFATFAQSFGVAGPNVGTTDDGDIQALADLSGRILEYLNALYTESFAILARLAVRVEQHFGFGPLPAPETTSRQPSAPPTSV